VQLDAPGAPGRRGDGVNCQGASGRESVQRGRDGGAGHGERPLHWRATRAALARRGCSGTVGPLAAFRCSRRRRGGGGAFGRQPASPAHHRRRCCAPRVDSSRCGVAGAPLTACTASAVHMLLVAACEAACGLAHASRWVWASTCVVARAVSATARAALTGGRGCAHSNVATAPLRRRGRAAGGWALSWRVGGRGGTERCWRFVTRPWLSPPQCRAPQGGGCGGEAWLGFHWAAMQVGRTGAPGNHAVMQWGACTRIHCTTGPAAPPHLCPPVACLAITAWVQVGWGTPPMTDTRCTLHAPLSLPPPMLSRAQARAVVDID
jgi:hypothetical protein